MASTSPILKFDGALELPDRRTEPGSEPGVVLPEQYLGFFRCFNQGEFFEAHEVLEALWLLDRQGPTGDFFKGLIQMAGAFVHFQKERPQPGRALLLRAQFHLEKYPPAYLGWPVSEGLALIDLWLRHEPGAAFKPFLPVPSTEGH